MRELSKLVITTSFFTVSQAAEISQREKRNPWYDFNLSICPC
jgi:hypothetical protein